MSLVSFTFPPASGWADQVETPSRSRTVHVRITPQWTDADHFTFRRENQSGAMETVQIDASTGEMFVPKPEAEEDASSIGFRGGPVPDSTSAAVSTEIELVNQTEQPVTMFWAETTARQKPYETIQPGKTVRQHTFVGHVWVAKGQDGTYYGYAVAESPPHKAIIEKSFSTPESGNQSPTDSKRSIDPNHPFDVRIDKNQFQYKLKSEADSESINWKTVSLDEFDRKDGTSLTDPKTSPDGKVVAFWIRTPGDESKVYTITSSPQGGGRAKLNTRRYPLPGDAMEQFRLVTVDTESWKASAPDLPVIDFGYVNIRWLGDHQMLIEKVDRGHQRFRLFAVNPLSAKPDGDRVRTIIDEETETFLWTAHGSGIPLVTYLDSGDSVIYSSEKSGYRHLYRVNLEGDPEMKPITQGDFLVRQILHIDEKAGYLDLVVGEYHDDQDPYHRHLIRVSLKDGSVTQLTDGDGDHEFTFSPDRRYVIVNHSRVDSPPVHELRRAQDGKLMATLAKAERIAGDGELKPLPTRFTAKGRDGKTDIYGLICFPDGYAPSDENAKSDIRFPVLESIYAGPHDSHVPKRYSDAGMLKDMTDLGFIVVRIDGMGTANRSKSFHDVAWKNLKDAGFPDRIAWMKAAADKYPAMDLSRVGIYGTSAGGQNACGALLFHGDFYKAAVASCGCHDNRMDKASWNEQWMGSEIGPHYAESSNIDQAHRLKGDLLLLVGELDDNVPPESTLRLVEALIKADKRFDFLMIPGMGHSDGGTYGRQLTREFFVEKLHPPSLPKPDSKPKPPEISSKQLREMTPVPTWKTNADLYAADRDRIMRQLPVAIMPDRLTYLDRFYGQWESFVDSFDMTDWQSSETESLARLKEQIDADRTRWDADVKRSAAVLAAHPWIEQLMTLCDQRDNGLPINGQAILNRLTQLCENLTTEPTGTHSESIADTAADLQSVKKEVIEQFANWRRFYANYDPQYDWWVGDAAKSLDTRLRAWDPAPVQLADVEFNSDVSLPDMLDADYPKSVVTSVPSQRIMPAIIDRYINDIRTVERSVRNPSTDESKSNHSLKKSLKAWDVALSGRIGDQTEFNQWERGDQVDYHRLRDEIAYRSAVIQDDSRTKLISKSADDSGIEGTVVGRDRLMIELRHEQIDQTPEELIALAEVGYAACREEMIKVSGEMGCGDDWQSAIEKIKSLHVSVGRQPALIRQTAAESLDWIREHDDLTVDRLAETSWRMHMMSPARQRVNPFFTGGEVISVSFPTRQMSAADKRQSLRGNNQPYARATVQHELIPGHHLQLFSNSRYQTHREPFGSPFWLEGWAVYWEFALYDQGFARTPEERMGFLVWRAHRYARILFSLRFHLGQLTPDQCVDFLVNNVGFDRRNAEGEVRRSVGPDYPPLYQAAYMLGAMQFRELADRWRNQERGSLKEFHDAVLRQNSIPIASLEAILFETPLSSDQSCMWRFDRPESSVDERVELDTSR